MGILPFSKIRNIILVAACAILVGGAGYRLGEGKTLGTTDTVYKTLTNTKTPDSANVDFSLFWDVWRRLNADYIDKSAIDPQKMVYGAIQGMVASLDDPYTSFFTPKENTSFKEDIGGSFQGIGAYLGTKENRIIIVAPLKGSPAEKVGLKPQDWILKVNNEETTGWTTDQAVSKIKGPKGTKVSLNILHSSATKPVDVQITRDEIVVPSVDSWIKKPSEITEISDTADGKGLAGNAARIAYIHLSRFGDRTNEEWQNAVAAIAAAWTNKTVKGLVFDLRNNPGGYLDGAVFIASEFLKSGEVVVTQQNSDGSKQDYKVERMGKLLDIPVVVLVNKGSASASEIVAGALKSHKRATVAGETSFGKGSVQTPEDLPGGSSIHITTGKWLLPNGDWIHKKGITPDVEVKLADDAEASQDAQLAKAIKLLLE